MTPSPVPTVTAAPTVTTAQESVVELETDAGPGLSSYWTPNVARWEELIVKYARHYQIDPNLIAAVMTVESGGDPNALSYAGAVGLLQVMPRDVPGFSSRPWASQLYDPDVNLAWGGRILASEIEWAKGDLTLALGAYYDGRARSLAGWARTRAYAQKVMTHYRAAKQYR